MLNAFCFSIILERMKLCILLFIEQKNLNFKWYYRESIYKDLSKGRKGMNGILVCKFAIIIEFEELNINF